MSPSSCLPQETSERRIAILDRRGVIVATNDRWEQFAAATGGDRSSTGPGASFLDICRRDSHPTSILLAESFELVLDGGTADPVDLACHPPDELQWFRAQVTATDKGSGDLQVSYTLLTRSDDAIVVPEINNDDGLMGSRCTDRFEVRPGVFEVPHSGCPGWWADRVGSGWACGCSCHADTFGWPGWHEAQTPHPNQ